MKVRLQKFLSEAGVASRRASEQIILQGRVAIKGEVVTQLGTKVDPAHDRVTLDGKQVKTKRKLYIALHKPRGYICSRAKGEERKTLGDLLPKEWSNLYSVGRLDYESEGLIFVTNDGEFALRLTHPRFGIRKKYRVIVEGRFEDSAAEAMMGGLVHEGERLRADKVRILRANNSQSVLEVELTQGKNREVRRLLEKQGFSVRRLQRIQIGPIKLGELPVGKWRTLTESEINSLLDSKL